MDDHKRSGQGQPEEPQSYTPASPVKRALAWIALIYVLIFLGILTYYIYTGVTLTNLGALLPVPGLFGLGIVSLISWRTTGRPGRMAAILLALVSWAAALAALPMGILGLLSNFGIGAELF